MKKLSAYVNIRPLLLLCIGVIIGIFCAAYGFLPAVLCITAVAGIILCSVFKKNAGLLFCIAFLLGFLRILSIHTAAVHFPGNNHVITATVKKTDAKVTILTSLSVDKKAIKGDMIIRRNTGFICGDRVYFLSAVTEDISISEKSKDASLLYAAENDVELTKVGESDDINHTFAKAREYAGGRIDVMFGDTSPIVKAVLFGDTSFLDESELTSYRAAGIAHILALSGLHVSIIALAIEKALFFIHKKVRVGIVGGALVVYMLFVGIPVSFARAVIMYILRVIAFQTNRRYDPLSALSLAAIIILAVNPYALYSASFILSFGTVLSIILLMKPIHKTIFRSDKTRLSNLGALTLSASVGIIPFSAAIFGTVSIYAFFVNLVCVPLAGFAVTLAFFGTIAGLVFIPLCVPFAFCAKLLFSFVRIISEITAMLPCAALDVGRIGIVSVLLFIAAEFIVSEYVMIGRKKKMIIVPVILAAAVLTGIW